MEPENKAPATKVEPAPGKNGKGGKSKAFPHALVILFVMLIIAMLCTYIVPAGMYERVEDPVSGRTIIDPDSFHYVDKTPVGPFGLFVSLEEGLIQAANITFLIFAAFSCLYLIEKTGAIDAAIAAMVRKTTKTPAFANTIIVILMVVLAAWGSTGTMSYEEIIAFVPIFVTVALALGYDAMVAIAISVIPVGVGFASATVNPFTIGVAQTIAELPLFSGLWYRFIILAVMTTFTVVYVMAYATRIRKDPARSVMYGIDYSDFEVNEERLATKFTTQRKLSLAALFVGVAVMAWGLITQGWYINEVAAVFMCVSIATGFINGWGPSKIASTLVEGMGKGVLSAIIVGVGRGILVIFTKGNTIDTIIHAFVSLLQNLSIYLSSVGMLIFQTLLNFLIPSGSGQAAVSMPIMTPMADLLGMSRQVAVLAFQFGDGFSNLLWPTGFMLLACSMAKVPLNKYYKWFLPYYAICFALQIVFIVVAVAIGYA